MLSGTFLAFKVFNLSFWRIIVGLDKIGVSLCRDILPTIIKTVSTEDVVFTLKGSVASRRQGGLHILSDLGTGCCEKRSFYGI